MSNIKISDIPAIQWDDPREKAVFDIFVRHISPALTGSNVTVAEIIKGIVKMVDACQKDNPS